MSESITAIPWWIFFSTRVICFVMPRNFFCSVWPQPLLRGRYVFFSCGWCWSFKSCKPCNSLCGISCAAWRRCRCYSCVWTCISLRRIRTHIVSCYRALIFRLRRERSCLKLYIIAESTSVCGMLGVMSQLHSHWYYLEGFYMAKIGVVVLRWRSKVPVVNWVICPRATLVCFLVYLYCASHWRKWHFIAIKWPT